MSVTLQDWLGIIGATIALLTFWKTINEYIKQGAAKRAEQFLEMRSRLRENTDFVHICNLLETDSSELKDTPLILKDNFIGFFEELALFWNSKVFNDEVVYYMFGYFALKCWRSPNFWYNLNRDQQVWGHFRDFVTRLEQMEKKYKPNRRKYRL